MTADTLGSRIVQARSDMGLSRRQVAAQVGVNASTLESWEQGRVTPRANKLQVLCGVLNVSVAWLLEGESELFNQESGQGDGMDRLAAKLHRAVAIQKSLGALLDEISTEFARLQTDEGRKGDLAA
jgi:transcriptional regulator with XRE-family HTH domain